MLTDIIGRYTKIPVLVAQDGVTVQPNNVYVNPPGKVVTVQYGRLKIETRHEPYHYPIDSLFISLAQEYKGNAIGVVLSGTGTDGTAGLRAIYARRINDCSASSFS